MNCYNSKLTSPASSTTSSSASLSPILNEQHQPPKQPNISNNNNNKRMVSGFSINDLINDSSSNSTSCSRTSNSPIACKKLVSLPAATSSLNLNINEAPVTTSTPTLQNYSNLQSQMSPNHLHHPHQFQQQWPQPPYNSELNLLAQSHHLQPPPQQQQQQTSDQQLALHYHLQREQALNIIRNGTRYFDPRFNMQCKHFSSFAYF